MQENTTFRIVVINTEKAYKFLRPSNLKKKIIYSCFKSINIQNEPSHRINNLNNLTPIIIFFLCDTLRTYEKINLR